MVYGYDYDMRHVIVVIVLIILVFWAIQCLSEDVTAMLEDYNTPDIVTDYIEYNVLDYDDNHVTFTLKNISDEEITVSDFDTITVRDKTIRGKLTTDFDGTLSPGEEVKLTLKAYEFEGEINIKDSEGNVLDVVGVAK